MTKTTRGAENDDDEEPSLEIETMTMVTMVSLEATKTMMTMSRKPRMLRIVTLEERTVTMVNLEASVMTKTGDASNVKGFKLSRTTMEHR